jgi:hypothetical protein
VPVESVQFAEARIPRILRYVVLIRAILEISRGIYDTHPNAGPLNIAPFLKKLFLRPLAHLPQGFEVAIDETILGVL